MTNWNSFQESHARATKGALPVTTTRPPRPRESPGQHKVGKNCPPKQSQFKPGQSGNPAGRPKGSSNIKTKVERELRKSVPVTKNGKPTRMTKGNVIVAQLVDSSMKGDVRTAAMVIRLTEDDVAAPGTAANTITESPMPDKDALKRIIARLQRLIEDED
jgi:hypothetical protein